MGGGTSRAPRGRAGCRSEGGGRHRNWKLPWALPTGFSRLASPQAPARAALHHVTPSPPSSFFRPSSLSIFITHILSEGEVCSNNSGSLHGGKSSSTTLLPRAQSGLSPRPYDLSLSCTSSSWKWSLLHSGSKQVRAGAGAVRPGLQPQLWSFRTACAQKSHQACLLTCCGATAPRVAVVGLNTELCGKVLCKLQRAEQMQGSLSPPPPCGFGGSQPT